VLQQLWEPEDFCTATVIKTSFGMGSSGGSRLVLSPAVQIDHSGLLNAPGSPGGKAGLRQEQGNMHLCSQNAKHLIRGEFGLN
jgi:hypothetical protein